MKRTTGGWVFNIWLGLAIIGDSITMRYLMALICLGAALCGERIIAVIIAVVFFASLMAHFNPPELY